MDNEIIKPWVERFLDQHGVVVETIGVDIVNHRVIYQRPGYEHDCICPRRDWQKNFRKVEP
ncbi:DUF4222 domain-containing protein [Mixta gaviniae]|uniref:DUF4222 domain-containing protein n=1 Tax=Mixta gaviniae TaxID=665914 RepID=A0A1X1EE15_9GAMM|nr:DUF4222 domain-containing protein [Mixta gaviniae]ORM87099.1 DUF4222 domain-containing protein [Mixta gaviniae]